MSFKNVDMESAMRRLAERRIEEAMREGKFDNLPGAGKPLDLDPMPADENARLMWWALRIMRNNDLTPDEVRWRKQIDRLRDELVVAKTEARATVIVKAINDLVRRVNTMGTNVLKVPLVPLALESELAKLRERIGQASGGAVRCANDHCHCDNPVDARYCRRCGGELGGM